MNVGDILARFHDICKNALDDFSRLKYVNLSNTDKKNCPQCGFAISPEQCRLILPKKSRQIDKIVFVEGVFSIMLK